MSAGNEALERLIVENEAYPYRQIARGLRHYAKRIAELKDDKDIRVGNEFMQRDLEANSQRARQLADNLERNMTSWAIDQNSQFICDALSCYAQDLANSKKALGEKLAAPNIQLENIDYEIERIGKIKDRYCRATAPPDS